MRLCLSRRLLCACLVFGLLFALSPSSYAEEYDFSQEELEYGIYYPTDKDFVLIENGKEVVYDEFNLLGDVSDNSSALKAKVGVYSRALNWRTDEEFALTSSIGYTKLFTSSNLSSVLSGKSCSSVATWESLMSGQFGYTIQLYYGEPGDDSNLAEGAKIGLALDFPCKVYSGSSRSATPGFTLLSGNLFHSVGSVNYLTSDSNILNLTKSYFSSNGPTEFYSNVVTVGYIDSETGSENVLATYDSIDSIDYVFTLPASASSVYVDVEFSPRDGVTSRSTFSGKNVNTFFFPLMYSFDVSGSISLDSSGVNTGLLKGIIQWLKNILNAITALPQQIANLVIEGVKSLFIPSSENIMATFDGLKTMAESKLGFLYTMFTMVYELFQSIVSGLTNPTTTLTIPAFSLPWIDGTSLTLWNEMTFPILPEGLDVLKDLVHLLTSLVLITATISHCVEYFRDFFKKE